MAPNDKKRDRDLAVAQVSVMISLDGVFGMLEIVEEALAGASGVGENHPLVYDLRWLRNKHKFRSKR